MLVNVNFVLAPGGACVARAQSKLEFRVTLDHRTNSRAQMEMRAGATPAPSHRGNAPAAWLPTATIGVITIGYTDMRWKESGTAMSHRYRWLIANWRGIRSIGEAARRLPRRHDLAIHAGSFELGAERLRLT